MTFSELALSMRAKTRSLVALTILMIGPNAFASDTAATIRGVVTNMSGDAVSGAEVVVINEATSLTRSATTDANGGYAVRNLQVGGNYSVSATNAAGDAQKLENISLSVGQITQINLQLRASTVVDTVVVTGTRITSQIALGPSSTFDLADLESAPAINRNITDVLRRDARVYVDESRGNINAVQCGGKNSRFNSLTVDGVRMNDSFGLNSNGYPTERMPFSYDAINQVSVELAPFDAQYGGFTACNINAVTKSGSNDFFGSAFYDYTDDGLRSDSLEGQDITTGKYEEKRRGFTLGGPVIADTVFFFAAFEELEGANLFDRGPIGSGAVNEVEVTQAELDEILDIARTLYQYDPGTIPSSMPNEDEKLLVKLDWFINEQHRAALTYNYNEGNNFVESDSDLSEFEFSNHLYERGAELTSYVGSLYSDWTDRFSTEIRYGNLTLDNRQISVGGTDFGEMRIELADVDVYIGGDDSRQSNKLDYEVDSISLTGTYALDEHLITFGYEHEALEMFNLFVPHSETEIRFDGIENFRTGYADAIYYNNSPEHIPSLAAANWGYELNTVFVQDEFNISDNVELLFGLRYDWYTTDDAPVTNPTFLEDYGFTNSATVDGEGLIQPRFGFTYEAADNLVIRGGIGLYSGGDPNVWLSNTYSNNNVLQFGQRGRSFGYTDGSRSLFDSDVTYSAVEDGVPAGPGYGIPSDIYDAVTAGVGDNFEINYLDPNFKIPSEWKYAIGATLEVDETMTISGDVMVTRGQDTAIWKRGDLELVGTTGDGYPDYSSVREPSFILTNSSKGNTSVVASVSVQKELPYGFNAVVSYAHTNAEDVNPMTSSVGFSNYKNRAFFDPQEEVLSTSNYEIKDRITLVLDWERALFGQNMTSVSLYASANQGPSYSYSYNGTINPYGFTPYLDFIDNVLEPGDARNDNNGSWWSKVDLMIQQEINLGFGSASAFLVVDNLTNLLNDEWGIMRKVDFPNLVVKGDRAEARIGDASRSEIRVGLRYEF